MLKYISNKYKSCIQSYISEMLGDYYEIEFILEDENKETDESVLSYEKECR